MTPELEERYVSALESIALSFEVVAQLAREVAGVVKKVDEENTRTVSARDVTRIPPASTAPRVPRPRAQL